MNFNEFLKKIKDENLNSYKRFEIYFNEVPAEMIGEKYDEYVRGASPWRACPPSYSCDAIIAIHDHDDDNSIYYYDDIGRFQFPEEHIPNEALFDEILRSLEYDKESNRYK